MESRKTPEASLGQRGMCGGGLAGIRSLIFVPVPPSSSRRFVLIARAANASGQLNSLLFRLLIHHLPPNAAATPLPLALPSRRPPLKLHSRRLSCLNAANGACRYAGLLGEHFPRAVPNTDPNQILNASGDLAVHGATPQTRSAPYRLGTRTAW